MQGRAADSEPNPGRSDRGAAAAAPAALAPLLRLAADALGAEHGLLLVGDPRSVRLVIDGGPPIRMPRERTPLGVALLASDGVFVVPDLDASPYADDPLHAALPGSRFCGAVTVALAGGSRCALVALDPAPRRSGDRGPQATLATVGEVAARLVAGAGAGSAGLRRDDGERRLREVAALALTLGSSADLPSALSRGFERLLLLTGADVGVYLAIRGDRLRIERVVGLPPRETSALLDASVPLSAAELTDALGRGGGRLSPLLLPLTELETLIAVPVRAPRRTIRFEGALLLGARAELGAGAFVLARAVARQLESLLLHSALRFELERTRESTLRSFGRALERRRREDEGHTERVVRRARGFATALGLDESATRDLVWGAYLHDIGKLALPDAILDQPRSLTPDERAIVDSHAEIGFDMSASIPFVSQGARQLVRHHHERWDGRGYPAGLEGEAIPLPARMFALIDVHDALTNERPYRVAWPPRDVDAWIRAQGGQAFDPWLTEVFLNAVAPAPRAGR